MTKKTKRIICVSYSALLLGVLMCGTFAKTRNGMFSKAADNPYVIMLEGNQNNAGANRLTAEEAAAGQFVRNSREGNPITFATSGADTISHLEGETTNQKWCDVKEGGYICNVTPLSGLQKIAFTGNWDYDVRVYYGSTTNYEYSIDCFVSDGVRKEINFDARGLNIQYFKYEIVHLSHPSATSTRFMEITYACDATLKEEAPTYTAGTDRTISLSKTYSVSDGVVSLDLKPDDPTLVTSVMLFNKSSWNEYFGYYNLKITGMDSYKGITATTLPDGYTRFTFKLSELNRTASAWNLDKAPADVNAIYIRGVWTTASGYAEAEADCPFVSTRGNAFTPSGYTYEFSGGTYTSKVVVDFKFTGGVEGENTSVRFMIGNWSDYYGYWRVYANGNYEGNPAGIISTEILRDGYIRTTIDLSIAGNSSSSTPAQNESAIEFLYISNRWSYSSGYVEIVSVINE